MLIQFVERIVQKRCVRVDDWKVQTLHLVDDQHNNQDVCGRAVNESQEPMKYATDQLRSK